MTTSKRQMLLLIAALFSNAVVADHSTTPDHNLDNLLCDLECHNNGVCRYLTKDPLELQKRMQGGHMVQQCLCPLGYRGISCDVAEQDDVEDCKGVTGDNDRCECAAAEEVSMFAGEQCRKPYTEFCASLSHSVGGHISYCTNGGKCRGDLISAERSPGDTSNNFLFQHAGCICPPEFHGDHCELLNKDYHLVYHKTQSHKKKDKDKSGLAFLITCVGALGVLALVFIRKVRRNRQALHSLPRPPAALLTARDGAYRDDGSYRSDSSSEEGDFGSHRMMLPTLLPTLT